MYVIPVDAGMVSGTIDLVRSERGLRPHRLPPAIRARDADPRLRLMEAHPSGVRVAVLTSASTVSLELHATRVFYRGVDRERGAVDVVVDRDLVATRALVDGDALELDMETGGQKLTPGRADVIEVDLPPHSSRTERIVEFWLPHNEQVDLVAIHADADVAPAPRQGPVWLHHGSSISQGSNASHPTGTWPAVAARRAGVQLINLGFGGSAMVDPFIARLIRDTPADLISLKFGINVVNADLMRLRSFVPAVHGFLDTIRDGHPTTPVLLISPTYCPIHEDTPGPGMVDPASAGTPTMRFAASGTTGDTADGRLTLRVIRDALAEIVGVRSDDSALSYLDGLQLYGPTDAPQLPLIDGLHPDTATHAMIGRRFAQLALAPGGPLATPARRGGSIQHAGAGR